MERTLFIGHASMDRGSTMKKRLFLTSLLIIMGVTSVNAAEIIYTDPYNESPYQSDQDNLTNTGRISEGTTTAPPASIVTMDGQVSETPVKAISVEAMYSDNIQTYNIPISYGFPLSLTGNKELMNFKLVIPYTSREVGTLSDSGLGDISVTTNYLIRFPQLLLDTKLVIKTPTGEVEDADVPLGTGSTDVGLYVNGTWYLDKLILKGGLGYGYNGDYDQSQISTKVLYGDEYLISGGADYKINDTMKAGGLFVYKSRAEDEFESAGTTMGYSPGMNTLDFIPNFTYFYSKYNVELIASATIPVMDSWNSDKGFEPSYDPDRSMSFSVSASKPF